MPFTDHMWWTSREFDEIKGHERSDTHHPHAAAPLCTPCNYARNTSGLPFPSPNGCPCTTDLLCAADTKGAHTLLMHLMSPQSPSFANVLTWNSSHRLLFLCIPGDMR